MESGYPGISDEKLLPNNVQYQQLIGSLLYLSVVSRPDIAAPVCILSSRNQNPRNCDWNAAKRIVRYLKTTKELELRISNQKPPTLEAYSDATWASDNTDRKSLSGNLFLLGSNPISWMTGKQGCVSLSSTEAELISAAEASQELLWLLDLLKDLELEQKAPIYFHQDNQSCLKICSSEKVSSRTKHVATKIHHLKDLQKKTVIKMIYCPTGDMKADILTKPLPRPTFEKLRYNLVYYPLDLTYLKTTKELELRISNQKPPTLEAYSDATWASDNTDRKSLSGNLFLLGSNPISWMTGKQGCVSLSSTEAELISAAEASQELLWLLDLLKDLELEQKAPIYFHQDNQSCLKIYSSEKVSSRTKHVATKIHHLKDLQKKTVIKMIYCPTGDMKADILTKPLPRPTFEKLRYNLKEKNGYKQTNEVCKLKKAIYGLKQAGRSWNTKIASTLIKNNFKQSIVDPCLFTKNEENHSIYLILYVDDMLLASDSEIIIQNTVKTLEKEFEIKNLGDPTQFIGIDISRNREGELLLSQKNKIQELVERYNLQEAKPTLTPMESGYPGISDEKLLPNNVQYQQLIGSLLYLSVVSRPDIAAPVCILSSRNQNPRNCDWNAAKRIVRYLKTTKELELRISNQKPPTLEAYSDATWASDNTDRKSLSGNLFLLGSNPISWMTGKQGCVSLSSTEAELISAAEASQELLWLLDLLKDLELEQKAPIYFHQDNQSCLKIYSSEKVSSRTKHVATKIHHLKDLQKKTVIKMIYCPTGDMKADILTKPLPRPTFEKLRYNLKEKNGYKQTNEVCKLKKAIYGLKQAGRSWNTKIASTLIKNNFKQSIVDPCLFTKNEENHSIYLILYVDDMLLASDSEIIIQNTVKTLEKEFEIKNLGDPTQFIGIDISRNREGELLLSQKNKIQELVERYNLQEAKPTLTPMESGYPGISDEKLLPNNVQYQQLIGSLLYLSVVSRPDIAAPVCILSSRNQNPRNCDWNAAKRIVRYLKTTKELELRISNQKPPTLEAYSDATWASDNTDRKSLSGNLFLLGSNPISWMTGKQGCVSLSSTEAELISAAEASQELLWLLDLLKDLELEQKAPIYFHQDNQSCLKICSSEKVSSRTKHVATKIHHLKDLQKKTVIKMIYCPTGDMKADILTKPLPRPTFEKLRYNLVYYPLDLTYLKTTKELELRISNQKPPTLEAYSDATWASDNTDRKSLSGNLFLLGSNPISWMTGKQGCVSLSSTEAELISAAEASQELLWLLDLLKDLELEQKAPIYFHQDNQSCLKIYSSEKVSSRTKHVATKIHHLKDLQKKTVIKMIYCPTGDMKADILTKPLPRPTFEKLRYNLNLGDPTQFIGIDISRNREGELLLSQKNKIQELVERYNLQEAKPTLTPMESGYPGISDEKLLPNNVQYQQLIGSLLYLSVVSRPDIAAPVCILSSRNQNPRNCDWNAAKRIVIYLKTTKELELRISNQKPPTLEAYSDATWASDNTDRKSLSGNLFLLGSNPISWMTGKQGCVSLSSTEAELISAAEASQELLWLLDLLKDLELEQKAPIYFHQDNQSCLKIYSSEKVSSRTKHVATKIHHLKDLQKKTVIKMIYCPTGDMKADILTKPLPRPTFEKLRYNLSIVDPCLFTKNEENHSIYLILYVDDMLLASDSEIIIQNTVKTLEKEFEIKNLGDPTQFIGIDISRNREGELLLSQKNKIQELVERYNLQEAKPTLTPMESGYPDQISQLQSAYSAAETRILEIVTGMQQKELELRISNQKPPTLEAYSDATWASDNTDRKSLSGNLFLLGSNPISWMTGKQGCVSLSSTEAELISAAEASQELLWLLDLLKDLELEQKAPIYFHQDNQSCLKICSSEKVSSRTKHVATKIHHLKDLQKKTVIKMIYCPTGDMKADILTKPLPRPTFEKLRYNLVYYPLDLTYLKTTKELELRISNQKPPTLEAYSDATWASDNTDRKSLSGNLFLLGSNPISWMTGKQGCVSLSSTEAELISAAEASQELLWLLDLLKDLELEQKAPIYFHQDNQSCLKIYSSEKVSSRTKHVATKIHHLKDLQKKTVIKMIYCPTGDMKADILTKPLPRPTFEKLRYNLKEKNGYKQTNEVCKLKKAIYGLKQAGRSWNTKIASTLIKNNFKQSIVDPCLFTKNEENHSIYLILYVDDMLLASDSEIIIQNTVKTLEKEFEIKNLGDPTQFIGIDISRNREGELLLSQKNKIQELVERYNLQEAKPTLTPMESGYPGISDEKLLPNNVQYQQLIGSLLYLSVVSRPDIAAPVCILSSRNQNPRNCDWNAAKRIVRYLKTTKELELRISNQKPPTLEAYSDATWASDNTDRKSLSGNLFLLGSNPISWMTGKQGCVSLSSTEAELISAAEASQELLWLLDLLKDLELEQKAPIYFHQDNQSCLKIYSSEKVSSRTKHVATKIHHLKDLQKKTVIKMIYCPTGDMKADILTKPLPRPTFEKLRYNLKEKNGYKQTNEVCKLKKAIYGLKQAGRSWNTKIASTLIKNNFKQSIVDPCLFTKNEENHSIYLILYVDDMLLASDSEIIIQNTVKTLEKEFEIKNLGDPTQFIGIDISRNREGELLLSQKNKIQELVERYNLQEAKPTLTPMESGYPGISDEKLLPNNVQYQQLIGSLLYLSVVSRPDIAAPVCILSSRNQNPRNCDWNAAKRIVRYLKTTKELELRISNQKPPTLEAYSDATWASDNTDRKSLSGNLFLLGSNPISWMTGKQGCVSLSSTEAELISAAEASQELLWLLDLLKDLELEQKAPIYFHQDNQSCLKICSSEKVSSRTKHVATKIHHLKDLQKKTVIKMIYCPTGDMKADILTKPLPRPTFEKLRYNLVMSPHSCRGFVG
ncbi:hypothetical protein LAZ67_23000010 [Cordylochernes scorpioides]|uniref:Reverse transcriptase Ty1/copia-type domain-containing protein n=1 Tax=Cordylochernes scorpioides TaxID=51811 RepID=A0ABY6LPZ0_9ARAC|nr:hypothetical protein LAZ67_23000010 [Cordylochernes scorpioides]